MLDLKDLRCFVCVYQLRGFARAAVELNTVQSNVSARIRKLEDEIGAPLLEMDDGAVRILSAPCPNVFQPTTGIVDQHPMDGFALQAAVVVWTWSWSWNWTCPCSEVLRHFSWNDPRAMPSAGDAE